MCIMCLQPEHMQTSIGRNGEEWWRQCCAVLAYLVHGSASKGNRSDDDAQVISCHRYLVIFHLFVEQLTSFSSLPSSSILAVLDHHHDGIEWHVPKTYVTYV